MNIVNVKPALLLFCLLSATCFGATPCRSLTALEGLVGVWESRSGDQLFRERWTQVSEDTFEGQGEAYTENAPQSSESLRLLSMSNQVFYLAKVNHNPLPVAFVLSSCAANTFVFENSGHDFPKQITYRLTGDAQLSVRVSDGKDKGFTLDFIRAGNH